MRGERSHLVAGGFALHLFPPPAPSTSLISPLVTEMRAKTKPISCHSSTSSSMLYVWNLGGGDEEAFKGAQTAHACLSSTSLPRPEVHLC